MPMIVNVNRIKSTDSQRSRFRQLFLAYLTCQNGWTQRQHCPDKYLFDDDLHTCNDYRKVFCGNRPSHEHGNNPCEWEQASETEPSLDVTFLHQVLDNRMVGTPRRTTNVERIISVRNNAKRRLAIVQKDLAGMVIG